jgi:hypothetical protein
MEPFKDNQMNSTLDAIIIASFLESGRTLARASHTAALVAGIGSAAAPSTVPRILFSGSLMCWLVECWFAVRVTIDASLFRHLTGDSADGWRRLDQLLKVWRLRGTAEGRSTAERSRGAIALWRMQAVVLAIQLAMLIAAVILQAMGL